MKFSRRGSTTSASWADWEQENVIVEDDAIRLAPDSRPAYRSVDPVLEEAAVPDGFVDVAVAACGHVFLLTADGRIYQHVPGGNELVRVDCAAGEFADARAIAVDADSLYVARGEPGRVRAYSRHVGGIRWTATAGVDDPVTFVTVDGRVHLLDRGAEPGAGGLRRIDADGTVVPVVTDLFEPIDADADADGNLAVLEPHVWGTEEDRCVVREVPAQALGHPPVPADDTVRIPPAGFRTPGGDPVVPTCLAAGEPGELVVGTGSGDPGEAALFSFRPKRAAFAYQAAVDAGTRALAVDGSGATGRLYVIDGDGELGVAAAESATRRNDASGAYDGCVRTRLDAGVVETQWHRLRLERGTGDGDTRVNVRYHATDRERPERLSRDPAAVPTDLTRVTGIGNRTAWRLRRAGIGDLAALAASDAETVAAIVSIEEIHVSPDDIADWQTEAADHLADGESGLQAVDGIGPVFADRLQAAGIETLDALIARDPDDISAVLGSRLRTVSTDRTATWIAEASRRLPASPDPSRFDWHPLPPDPTDALLEDAVGRYLWVELELVGSSTVTPTIDTVDVSYPRQSYLDDLPAVYRADAETSDFLEPFLALFESVLTEIEGGIEDLVRQLDPAGIPGDGGHLAWLGEWLAAEMDEGWPPAAKREFIANAPRLYRMRGTRRGLEATIQLYLKHVEVDSASWDRLRAVEDADETIELVRVVEHADLACATDPDAYEPYSRLISCPQGFLVLLHPALEEKHRTAIGRIVGYQRPAHTSGRAVALRPMTVLTGDECGDRGFHSYLGINAVLPSRSFDLEAATLGQQTVLGEHEPHGALGVRARLDEDARLS